MIGLSGAWIVIVPGGDHPLLALVETVRRVGAMQQTLTEMGRGERFVMGHLRTRARERERWSIGVVLAALGLAGAGVIFWRMRRPV